MFVRGVPGRPWGYRDHVLLTLGRILSVGGATLSFAILQMQDAGVWAWLIRIMIRTIKGVVWTRQWTFEFHSIFSWPCISSQIFVNNQPDALFHVFIYLFHLSTCFEHQMLIIRRSNCINTSSGMISLCGCLVCRSGAAYQAVTQTNHPRWCFNTIRSPDDEHLML